MLKTWTYDLTTVIVFVALFHLDTAYSRSRYRNALMRTHHHDWNYGDILDSLINIVQLIFNPNRNARSPWFIAPLWFLFDSSNNGTAPFLGLSGINQRNAAYVSLGFKIAKIKQLLHW
jgi:hypothetical protein